MRTVDNLAGGTSYFLAELSRLKELVEMAGRETRLLIILDEILKGTNSVDKLNGSRRFLRKLLDLPVAGIVATHDLELGELAAQDPGHYVNGCFEIVHEGDEIVYDYRLKPGVSRNMNASILLERMGLC
jgi:DNA mismatch repair ATPase MutS